MTIEDLAELKGIAYGVLKPGPIVPNGVLMLRVGDIQDGQIDETAIYRIGRDLDQEFRRTKLKGGEIVISIQGSVGRVAVVPAHLAGANVSRTLAMVRLRDPGVARWVQRALESPFIQQMMRDVVGGTTRDSLNLRDLRKFAIPIAPEPVRSELLEAIERSGLLVASSARHVAAARRAVERFRQAALAAATDGRLTADWRAENTELLPDLPLPGRKPRQLRDIERFDLDEIPEEWKWVQVEDLLPEGGIFDGPFGSNLKTADYTTAGARVIRLENIGHLEFIDSKKTYVSKQKYQDLSKHAVRAGDIVFSSFVDESVRVCVLPDDLELQALAKADCFTLRPSGAVDRSYLAMQLASVRTYGFLASDVHGATRPRINTTQLRSVPVPLCSLTEQSEIVRRFTSLTSAADDLLDRVDRVAARVQMISQSVLAMAFRGELQVGEAVVSSSKPS